ncbi:MAG: response regulator transcription factor [Oscillospiraceae bacterium]|nr:response regulator transcription factor [Oscillospiraceae bacterium]
MRFAIVDDDKMILDQIKRLLEKLVKDVDIKIDIFTESSEFMKNYNQNKYDAFLLDIDMPEPNGFKLAEMLRDNNSDVPIIYVTCRDELVINAFRYKPLGFVRKFNMEYELEFALLTLFEQKKKYEPTIKITELRSNGGKEYVVFVTDISYLESENHNLNFHLVNGEVISTRKALSKYSSHEYFSDFILINSGILVNLNHIRISENKVVLPDGKILYISRRKVRAVREAYLKSQRRVLI